MKLHFSDYAAVCRLLFRCKPARSVHGTDAREQERGTHRRSARLTAECAFFSLVLVALFPRYLFVISFFRLETLLFKRWRKGHFLQFSFAMASRKGRGVRCARPGP